MNIIYRKKSEKTKNRINELKNELMLYQENIELLHGYHTGKLTLKGGDYCDRAAYIRRTQDDDARYIWTLNNIKMQILLIEREIEALLRYGS